MSRILLIDDDRDILTLLERFLSKNGYEVRSASNGAQGEKLVTEFNPDLVLSDYRLDDMDGSVLLAKIREIRPTLPVIIITGYSDLRTAIRLVRDGAYEYMTKPLIPDEILLNIKQALSKGVPDPSPGSQRAPQGKENTYKYLLSKSAYSQNLENQISLVAPTNYSVIIYGESGTGKEGVARMIHDRSKRSNKPFVAMDCGAISRELAGSELFGHEKGSFTGAVNQKIGHFEMANGGTLFLDEIGNLPYDMQALLLRVLQEKVLRRIGGNKEINVDTRIIVATNERLMGGKFKFREDLYHRLNEFQIELSPLNKRRDDIMFFAEHFLREISKDLGKEMIGFGSDVREVFLSYPWPGNIRELKNVIKKAALLSTKNVVDIRALPFEILNHAHITFEPETFKETTHEVVPAVPVSPDKQHSPSNDEDHQSKPNLKKVRLGAEHQIIQDALLKANNNRSKAAEILGVDRKTLYNKLKRIDSLNK